MVRKEPLKRLRKIRIGGKIKMIKTDKGLNAKIKEIKQLEAHMDDLKAQIETLRTSIKEYMDSNNLDSYHTDMWKITYKEVITMRPDATKLKEDGLFDKYAKPSKSKPLYIR